MTKDKLLEFYNKLCQKEISVSILRQLRKCSDEELDIILNSNYPSVMVDVIINNEFKLLKKEEQTEIINIINSAKIEEIAIAIYNIVRSGTILSSGLTLKIIRIIAKANPESIPYITELALNISFLINPNSFKIMKIISSSKKGYQALYTASIVKNIDVLLNGNLIEIVKIASKTEGEHRCSLINIIAKNRAVLSSGLVIPIIEKVSQLNKETIEVVKYITQNKYLEKNKNTVYYLEKIFNAKTSEEINNIYKEAELEIQFLKQQESLEKNDNGLFWNVYKNNHQKAIELLNNFDKNEITPLTRIRKNINRRK